MDLVGAERIKKAGVINDTSFCETAFRLKNLVQTYENLNCLTKTKILKKKRPRDLTLNMIINRKIAFASIFWKVFKFSNFFVWAAQFPLFLPSSVLERGFWRGSGQIFEKAWVPPLCGNKIWREGRFWLFMVWEPAALSASLISPIEVRWTGVCSA